jgi:hypothetical protein
LNKLNSRKGISFVELIVYSVIFAIFVGMVTGVFFWLKQSQSSVKKLDMLHVLRGTTFALAKELSMANKLIYPGVAQINEKCFQLVYCDSSNNIIGVYLNKNGELVKINLKRYKDKKPKAKTNISKNTVNFTVIRKDLKYLEFEIKIVEKLKNGKEVEFALANSARLKNYMD